MEVLNAGCCSRKLVSCPPHPLPLLPGFGVLIFLRSKCRGERGNFHPCLCFLQDWARETPALVVRSLTLLPLQSPQISRYLPMPYYLVASGPVNPWNSFLMSTHTCPILYTAARMIF